jgi:choline dehydrogenase-like flavoprotein
MPDQAAASVSGQSPARLAGTLAAASLTAAERRLKGLLRTLTAFFLVATLALIVIAEINSVGAALQEAPWIGPAAATGALLVGVCSLAAGDPRRRFGLLAVIEAVLVVAALCQLAYLLAGSGADRALGAEVTGSDRFMIAVLIGELLLAAILFVFAAFARQARLQATIPELSSPWRSAAAAGLGPLLWLVGLLAAAGAVAAAIGPFVGSLDQLFEQPALSAHLAAGGAGGAILCFYIAAGLRDRVALVGLLILSLLVAVAAGLIVDQGHASQDDQISVLGFDTNAQDLVWIAVAAAAASALVLAALRRLAFRARLKPKYFGATEYRALMALADVIVQEPDEAVPPDEIARNVDDYINDIRAWRRILYRVGLIGLQLHPLLYLKAPFSALDEASRLDHLKTHLYRDVLLKLIPDFTRRYVQVMLRMATQLTYLGYYNDPRSFPSVGYQPFPERERYRVLDQAGKIPTPGEHPLNVNDSQSVDDRDIEADICVIGSGAAGAVLAYRLAEICTDESIVVLERGQYVQPKEFTWDEVKMISKLYGDGVFQQTEDFRFTVLQGSCVGGSTVVNNAVSIPLPERVLTRWNKRYLAGIDPGAFYDSSTAIENWLPISSQAEGPANPDIRLNPSAPKFLSGVEQRREADPDFVLETSAVRANIKGCLGCGYCNIGCRYGKKLSMLDTVLPWAQERFGDRVRIYADCPARKIVADGSGRVGSVRAKLGDGRKLNVQAKKVVVAAGTVASSRLLQRSGIGKGLPVGRNASFNMGAPLTAEFDDEMEAFDGLQISHLGLPKPERGWVFETWWNPPVSQALNMPGWFEDHYANMRRYQRLMAVGVLVGTERNARVGWSPTGPAIHYVPTAGDLRKLADGLIELGQILFAGGAKAVMVNAWDYYRFTSPNGLFELPTIMQDPSQVALGTGHPQGGNAMGSDPALSVVDPNFKVHGYANLFLCDASVFPSSITVNPQLTVMSLAHYAAPLIAAANGSP